MIQKIILGKYLKIGDVIPGGTPEYNRTVDCFDNDKEEAIVYLPWFHKRRVHRTVNDTYRTVHFKESRLSMTVFDNSPITILYKKHRRNNKIGL